MQRTVNEPNSMVDVKEDCNIANWGSNKRTPNQEVKRWTNHNDGSLNTLLHDLLAGHIFEKGHILEPNIPPAGVYEKGLHRENMYGDTPLHNAAASGHLHWIPAAFLTKKGLTSANNIKDTPMHYAAKSGQLDQIPIKFLTEENLSMRNANGVTPLEEAEKHNHLDQLLEIKFSPAILALVSQEWFDKNEQLIKQKENVGIPEEQTADIEIF